jgi:non-homologous end joining protein Ku
MVTIPVKLYSATEERDVRFRLVHRKDGSPIVEKRFCSAEDKEVSWDAQYKDEFRGALLELIERRMKGERRSTSRRKPEPKVIDLMDALQASLEASKAGKSAPARRVRRHKAA